MAGRYCSWNYNVSAASERARLSEVVKVETDDFVNSFNTTGSQRSTVVVFSYTNSLGKGFEVLHLCRTCELHEADDGFIGFDDGLVTGTPFEKVSDQFEQGFLAEKFQLRQLWSPPWWQALLSCHSALWDYWVRTLRGLPQSWTPPNFWWVVYVIGIVCWFNGRMKTQKCEWGRSVKRASHHVRSQFFQNHLHVMEHWVNKT